MDSTRSTIPYTSIAIPDSVAAEALAVAVTVSQLPPVITSCDRRLFESAFAVECLDSNLEIPILRFLFFVVYFSPISHTYSLCILMFR